MHKQIIGSYFFLYFSTCTLVKDFKHGMCVSAVLPIIILEIFLSLMSWQLIRCGFIYVLMLCIQGTHYHLAFEFTLNI